MSSAVHLLTTQDSGGQRRQAVLRRYVRAEQIATEPDIVEREARALRAAEPVDIPTPAPLAVDPAGAGAGVPAVLMSRLPGRVEWWPRDPGRWLRGLAGVLPAIHDAPLPAAGLIGSFAPSAADTAAPLRGRQGPPALWRATTRGGCLWVIPSGAARHAPEDGLADESDIR